eukprot:1307376-Amphidinium_carterae.1
MRRPEKGKHILLPLHLLKLNILWQDPTCAPRSDTVACLVKPVGAKPWQCNTASTYWIRSASAFKCGYTHPHTYADHMLTLADVARNFFELASNKIARRTRQRKDPLVGHCC